MLQLDYIKLKAAYNNKAIHNSFLQFGLPIVCIYALLYADSTSLFSYGYSLFLLVFSSHFICKKEKGDLLFSYHFYLLFAIIFYLIFKNQFPLYLGMTGPGDIGGADDSRFYAQIVDGNVPYPIMVSLLDVRPYSVFLKILYPFKVNTPLNIVTSILIFTSYLPIYARQLSNLLSPNKKIGYYVYWFTLLCPFTIYFGCIILRDLITGTLVIAGLCYYMKKEYLPLLICVVMIIWIRFGTIAFFAGGIIILYRFLNLKKGRSDLIFAAVLILLVLFFYFSFSFIQEFSGGKLEDGIIRSTDSERYEGTTISAILSLPFPLNIIISAIFFFFIPLISIPYPIGGHYLIGVFFQGFFTPIFMFFLWRYIYNAICVAILKKQINVQTIFLIVVVFSFLLGSISMQSRHKTVLFPIICILAAYGKVNYDKKYDGVSKLLTSLTIGAQVVLVLISLVSKS